MGGRHLEGGQLRGVGEGKGESQGVNNVVAVPGRCEPWDRNPVGAACAPCVVRGARAAEDKSVQTFGERPRFVKLH